MTEEITNAVQNTQLDALKEFLNLKFEVVSKDIARLDGKYQEFERKNCDKHTVIQDLLSSYRGEITNKLENLQKEMYTREQFDRFLESNNGKWKMVDDRITKNDDKINDQKSKLDRALWILGIFTGAIIFFGNHLVSFILSYFKK